MSARQRFPLVRLHFRLPARCPCAILKESGVVVLVSVRIIRCAVVGSCISRRRGCQYVQFRFLILQRVSQSPAPGMFHETEFIVLHHITYAETRCNNASGRQQANARGPFDGGGDPKESLGERLTKSFILWQDVKPPQTVFTPIPTGPKLFWGNQDG